MAEPKIKTEGKGAEDTMRQTWSATAKKQKPRSLPPPREALTNSQLGTRSVAKKSALAKKTPTRAMTTAKNTSSRGQAQSSSDVAKTKGALPPNVKPPGMMKVLESHSTWMNEYSGSSKQKVGKLSVLIRPTARALRIKEQQAAKKPINTSSDRSIIKREGNNNDVFSLMGLPNEVRAMIWRYAVVDLNFFIWPETVTGREQPDLAMVCREIREEVLPIYYAENIFGVNVSPGTGKSSSGQQNFVFTAPQLPKGIAIIEKWAKGLKNKGQLGWFAHIRRWNFSYETEPSRTDSCRIREEDGSLLVSVNFSKGQEEWWDSAAPEVHREAFCVLPGREEYGRCIIRTSPNWLHGAVIAVHHAAKGGSISGEMIAEMAKSIQARIGELAEYRCIEVKKSIEAA